MVVADAFLSDTSAVFPINNADKVRSGDALP